MNDLVRRPDVGDLQPYTPRGREFSPPRGEDGLDPRRLVTILLQRKWQILLVAALVVLPAMMMLPAASELISRPASEPLPPK